MKTVVALEGLFIFGDEETFVDVVIFELFQLLGVVFYCIVDFAGHVVAVGFAEAEPTELEFAIGTDH